MALPLQTKSIPKKIMSIDPNEFAPTPQDSIRREEKLLGPFNPFVFSVWAVGTQLTSFSRSCGHRMLLLANYRALSGPRGKLLSPPSFAGKAQSL